MTEKRFTKVSSEGYWKIKDSQADYKEIWDLTNPQLIEDRLNQLNDENEQLKQQRNSCLNDLNKLEIAIEKVQNEFKDNQEVQRAIARIVVIKRELKGDVE